MKIQLNTDHNISGDDKINSVLTSMITTELKRYSARITRVEIHLADENGYKEGANDKRCIIEARPKGKKPVVVTSHGSTPELAVENALDKLKISLERLIGDLIKQS